MRVLIINDAASIGGVEIVLMALIRHLAKRCEVEFLYHKEPFALELPANARISRSPYKYAFKDPSYKPLRELRRRICARKIARSLQPADLIIGFKPNGAQLAVLLASYMPRARVIASLHGHFKADFSRRMLSILRASDAVTTLTAANAAEYERAGICAQVLPNPLLFEALPLRKERLIMLAQRLDTDKRADLFVGAICLLARHLRRLGWRALVIGDGRLKQALMQQGQAAINAGVLEFCGALEHKKVRELYARASIAVVASPREGYCIGLAEPSFYGCARLSTRFEGESLSQLARDEHDALLCGFSEREMAAQLLRLVRDEALRTRLISAQRELASALGSGALERWDELIARVLS